MKKFVLGGAIVMLLLGLRSVLAFEVPAKPQSFVNDYAGVLSAEERNALENKISNFEKATTNEIAVVTINSLDGDAIENVAQDIFTKWGIGKADKDNGVLFLVAVQDRNMRIHTGYGAEGDLTDIGTAYIQDEVVAPAFRDGMYYKGIDGAVDKMIAALGGSDIVPSDYSTSTSFDASKFPWEFAFVFGIFVFKILSVILGKSKSWWGGGVLGGVVAMAIWHFFISSIFAAMSLILVFVGAGLLFDFLVSRAYHQATIYKNQYGHFPWWWFIGGGRGGGGGFGGSGFGGFGGGSSGGGGSSSSW